MRVAWLGSLKSYLPVISFVLATLPWCALSAQNACPSVIASPGTAPLALVLSGGGARGLAHIGVLPTSSGIANWLVLLARTTIINSC